MSDLCRVELSRIDEAYGNSKCIKPWNDGEDYSSDDFDDLSNVGNIVGVFFSNMGIKKGPFYVYIDERRVKCRPNDA